ncbi:hypothetical protein SAMN05216553_101598 [Lentzea fradiae]|uniref:Uncharacterized protein n=1 Tax=Lentzea fradiae TaxID=200378 RepID=A0A1G7L0N4_9PSEU|nr:hypothetical protein [Lentzea fradiae]SDF42931.1 hypothetical protein SAMN05216553_101598 [Lentzea fradiae]
MTSQTITWTVLPNGIAAGLDKVFFSVHVAPRLTTAPNASGTLRDFPDWQDWPATVSAATFGLELTDLSGQGGSPLRVSATRVSKPVSARWTALFALSSHVAGHALPKLAERRLRSYPTRHVRDFVHERYGRFGARYAEEHPTLDALAAADGFGPVGFEFDSDRTGPGLLRKQRLREELEQLFDLGPGGPQKPIRWAVPFRPGDATTADGIALSFLQAERFHRRREQPPAGDPPKLTQPKLDFHQVVSMTREYDHLQRLLGLVLDFESADPALLSLVRGNERVMAVRVVTDLKPVLGKEADVHVRPTMRCKVGKGVRHVFTAVPQDSGSDLRDGMLLVGDTDRFAVVQVDPDSAALAVRQFADTVTRARYEQGGQVLKRSSATPDRQALPSLHTAGFSVGRLSRAARLAETIDRNRKNNDAAFRQDGWKITDDIALSADDVVRGYRWDVRDETTGRWFSLMWRDGAYMFDRTGDEVAVLEETAAQTAATTSGAEGDQDLYVQESLMHWAGWSLAVGRPGKGLAGDNGLADNDGLVDKDFPFRTKFSARALPRLRFGRRYRLRARAVDIAGNSVTAEQADAMTDSALSTAAETFRRFEPVPAPEVLLRSVPGEAESLELMVLRGNTGSDTNVGTADRHVLPPRSTVQVAEQHGMLDRAVDGRPMDAVAYADLAARDAAVLEQHSSAHTLPAPADDHWYYDTDTLPVPYLPEPLARRVLVRGLPGSTTTFTIGQPTGTAWPDVKGFRLRLQQGTPGWSWNGTSRVLTVRLMPGDSYQLQLSTQFDSGDLDLMALWPLVEKAATAWNAAHPADQVNVTALRDSIVGGRHWMFTPARTLTLTHAVRTPLAVPDISSVTARRPAEGQLGSTHAVLGPSMRISRKSSGGVEFAGRWQMPVDDGVNPVQVQDFRAAPITVTVDRTHGPAPDTETLEFQARHEFGDTKHRRVRYEVRAVTRFSEFFREHREVAFNGVSHTLGVPIDPAHLAVVDEETGQQYLPGPVGSDAAKAPGDYVVTNAANGTFNRTDGGRLTSPRTLQVSFVRPETRSAPAVFEQNIPSTARPAAPKIRQIVPIFRWENPAPGRSVRHGGGLRVYLERPWFSSGAGEKLAVLMWPDVVTDVPEHMQGVVTMWGNDGTMHSSGLPDDVTPSSFPQAAVYGSGSGMTVPEFPDTGLRFAAYDVAYDEVRGLWYCDIRITRSGDDPLPGYFPFVRLALARYQPNSLYGCYLSAVATADFTQLAPDRTVVVTGSGSTRTVQLVGPGPLLTDSGRLNEVRVTVERQLDGVTDPVLRWQPAGGGFATTITTPTSENGVHTWSGTVSLPTGAGALRLVVEEFEVHRDGNGGTAATRLVHTDTVALS